MIRAITTLRTEKGMTQQQLAAAAGISKGAISNYENGHNGVAVRNLKKIADALGVTIAQLVSRADKASTAAENTAAAAVVQESTEDYSRPIPIESVPSVPGKKGNQLNFVENYVMLRFVTVAARAGFAEIGHTDPDLFDTIAVPVMPGETAEHLQRAWVFEVNGDSMEPTLYHGNRVICYPVSEGDWEYASDGVFVISYAGRLVIKRIKTNDLRTQKRVMLWSDNEQTGGKREALRHEIQGLWKVDRRDVAPKIY